MFWGKSKQVLTQNATIPLDGKPSVSILLRVSKRARRMSLRVSALDGRVTLTVPHGVCRDQATSFAHERAEWIRGHVARSPDVEMPTEGTVLPFCGKDHLIARGNHRTVRIADGRILLPPGDTHKDPIRLEAFLKSSARDKLAAASDHYCAKLGRGYQRISLRDTRSRWGSCSSQGNLSYSWRLIMAPEDVLDYVAAHEVAHLQHMDHSSAFWNLVEDLCPSYRTPRTWLRENGAHLHRFRFRD